jgi:hypothetical protein
MNKNSWLIKPRPRPKVLQYEAFGIAFLAHFHNILELNIKMQQQLFHWLRNAKQINIWNLTKVNGIHETKQEKNYETKRNFTYDETKRNETKFRCIYCFAKQAKFRETNLLFRFVSCFAKQKKGCEMETLVGKTKPWIESPNKKYSVYGYSELFPANAFLTILLAENRWCAHLWTNIKEIASWDFDGVFMILSLSIFKFYVFIFNFYQFA